MFRDNFAMIPLLVAVTAAWLGADVVFASIKASVTGSELEEAVVVSMDEVMLPAVVVSFEAIVVVSLEDKVVVSLLAIIVAVTKIVGVEVSDEATLLAAEVVVAPAVAVVPATVVVVGATVVVVVVDSSFFSSSLKA